MTTFTVPEGVRRERADKVLAHAFPEHSRGAFQRVLEAGLVLADGQVIAQDQEVKSGQVLEFSFPATTKKLLNGARRKIKESSRFNLDNSLTHS